MIEAGSPRRAAAAFVQIWGQSAQRLLSAYGIWLVAGLAALAAGWAVQQHIDGKEREMLSRNTVVLLPRLVAGRDLAAGHVLADDDIALREIPQVWASPRSLSVEHLDRLLGMRLRVAVAAGEPLLVADTEADVPAMATRLAPGTRALTLSLRELAEAPPELRVGDYVDLYLSLQRQGRQLTLPLLQNGMVIAPPAADVMQVVLQASAQDVLRVIAARQLGALTMTLRAAQDEAPGQPAQAVDVADVLGLERAAEQEVPVLYGDSPQEMLSTEEP